MGDSLGDEVIERRLSAVLSADGVGYGRLIAVDEDATVREVAAMRGDAERLVPARGGRLVDFTGDNFLAVFPTAVQAARCAVDIQTHIAGRRAELQLRIGIELGDVRFEGDRVFGRGVIAAARLEALAAPGGLCVSSTVHDQLHGRLDVDFTDLGERTLKNLPGSVRVYAALALPDGGEASAGSRLPDFPDRRAVAVLPFEDRGTEPDQEYLADGITEELIVRLSRLRTFPVLSESARLLDRLQAAQPAGKRLPPDARYLVQGSVQRAGDRVRISVRLIDGQTGQHLWAKRFECSPEAIFEVQDQAAEEIFTSLHPELMGSEMRRAAHRAPDRFDAWDCLMRAVWHAQTLGSQEANLEARAYAQRAIDIDPGFARAWAVLASTHYQEILAQWTESREYSVAELERAARRAVELDAEEPSARIELARFFSLEGRRAEQIAALETAVRLNPSLPFAYSWLGQALAMTGRPDEAVETLERALRLSADEPVHPLFNLAVAHFAAGRYQESVRFGRRAVERLPGYILAHGIIAAAEVHRGRRVAARDALAEVLRLSPGFTLSGLVTILTSADVGFSKRLIDSLRTAGLPE